MSPPSRSQRVAALGGGHGLAAGLRALRGLPVRPCAIVTTADDGGSSGRLRRELGIIPPGDLRMALLALAEEDRLTGGGELLRVLAHRFHRGELAGHALGNLLLVAMAEQSGDDFVRALDDAADLLACAGRVLPATTASVQLAARVAGAPLRGQAQITGVEAPVEEVWLEPTDPPACEAAIAELERADAIVLGPGSLYTSVVATLLVPELAAAVATSPAPVVYVANLRTQRGESAGLDLAAHVAAVQRHVGRPLDVVVAHDGPVRREPDAQPDPAPVQGEVPAHLARRVDFTDLAARDEHGAVRAVHDPARLATALAGALGLHVAAESRAEQRSGAEQG